MGILSILSNKNLIIYGIAAISVVGLYIYIKSLKTDIALCEAQRNELATKFTVSQDSVQKLSTVIDEQNAAVQKLKVAAEERARANRVEITKAKTVADTYKQQAADILKNVAPQGQPKCDSANFLINQEIQRAK